MRGGAGRRRRERNRGRQPRSPHPRVGASPGERHRAPVPLQRRIAADPPQVGNPDAESRLLPADVLRRDAPRPEVRGRKARLHVQLQAVDDGLEEPAVAQLGEQLSGDLQRIGQEAGLLLQLPRDPLRVGVADPVRHDDHRPADLLPPAPDRGDLLLRTVGAEEPFRDEPLHAGKRDEEDQDENPDDSEPEENRVPDALSDGPGRPRGRWDRGIGGMFIWRAPSGRSFPKASEPRARDAAGARPWRFRGEM